MSSQLKNVAKHLIRLLDEKVRFVQLILFLAGIRMKKFENVKVEEMIAGNAIESSQI